MTKSRAVLFSETARADLLDIYEWISNSGGWVAAGAYVERIERTCMSLDLASERGSRRDDVRPGLRIVGFEGRISIAFVVNDDRVEIIRLFRAGRDWQAELSEN